MYHIDPPKSFNMFAKSPTNPTIDPFATIRILVAPIHAYAPSTEIIHGNIVAQALGNANRRRGR